MLTKELILFKAVNHQILPTFINPESEDLRRVAGELIGVYQTSMGLTRGELEEAIAPIILAHRRTRLLKGLNKLLLDRTEFEKREGEEIAAKRERLFKHAAELLKQGKSASLEAYREEVISGLEEAEKPFALDFFCDLASREPLKSFKEIGPETLLHRYNCALPQSLLLYAKHIQVRFKEPNAAVIRQLFSYLKFFRLMAEIKKEEGDFFKIEIDGPLSLFEQTQKYGLQLALFFPAILLLSQWELTASIHLPHRRKLDLVLNQDLKLRSHYERFASHIPREIDLFRQSLGEKLRERGERLIDGGDYLSIGSQDIAVPDFVWVDANGEKSYLEIFHRFHLGALKRRLKGAKTLPPRYLIGVDRAIAKKREINPLLEAPYFKRFGFLFSGFPKAEGVLSRSGRG